MTLGKILWICLNLAVCTRTRFNGFFCHLLIYVLSIRKHFRTCKIRIRDRYVPRASAKSRIVYLPSFFHYFPDFWDIVLAYYTFTSLSGFIVLWYTTHYISNSPCISIFTHRTFKYFISEFWRICVPLWLLFRKWSMKGICLRERWGKRSMRWFLKFYILTFIKWISTFFMYSFE